MKRLLTFLTLPLLGADWYASPVGSARGSGTLASPWSLAHAVSRPSNVVAPGDTIYLRGGTYGQGGGQADGAVIFVTLQGTQQNPITIRSYPGEWAIINGGLETNSGGYVIYRDFEVYNSLVNRTGSGNFRPSCIALYAGSVGNKIINTILHDCGQPGINFYDQGSEGLLYGNICYHNGHYDTSAGGGTPQNPLTRGDCVYSQNLTGNPVVENNFFFRNWTHSGKSYTEGGSGVVGFRWRKNAMWENGERGLFIGNNCGLTPAPCPIDDIIVDENVVRQSINGFKSIQVGFEQIDNLSATVTNNYMMAGNGGTTASFYVRRFTGTLIVTGNTSIGTNLSNGSIAQIQGTVSAGSWDNNTYHGGQALPFHHQNTLTYHNFAGWQSATGLDANSTYSSSLPSNTVIKTWANAYEANRVHVVVVNWPQADNVSVDLTGLVAVGTRIEIRDVQCIKSCAPLLTTFYQGGTISIPMTNTTIDATVGTATHMTMAHTGKVFGAFLVKPIGSLQSFSVRSEGVVSQ